MTTNAGRGYRHRPQVSRGRAAPGARRMSTRPGPVSCSQAAPGAAPKSRKNRSAAVPSLVHLGLARGDGRPQRRAAEHRVPQRSDRAGDRDVDLTRPATDHAGPTRGHPRLEGVGAHLQPESSGTPARRSVSRRRAFSNSMSSVGAHLGVRLRRAQAARPTSASSASVGSSRRLAFGQLVRDARCLGGPSCDPPDGAGLLQRPAVRQAEHASGRAYGGPARRSPKRYGAEDQPPGRPAAPSRSPYDVHRAVPPRPASW